MKLAIATALLYAAAASAWKLDLWTTDGRHTSMHGRLDACNNIAFVPTLNVNRAKFVDETLDTVSTFELYRDKGCQGLLYRNDGGDYRMTARLVRSYKVH
ncbi:hypothetical protein B0T18DRAFT_401114 [Schizothecium vesticola]|uniref:Uncharacterized protein n=1 Tax=Schizothecium vesticola TaxID=314040 RepID=A0AA40F429_9PEZI|nr:hypothetical protein B0T18DRAFT_401114 [Schizothecium vesticola]